MDQIALVRENIDAAGTVLLRLQEQFPVRYAFLAAEEDSDNPRLYILVEDIQLEDDILQAVFRIAREESNPNFNPLIVSVMDLDTPMSKKLLEFIDKHGSKFSTFIRGTIFGPAAIDRIYLYASPLTPAHVG